MALEDSMKKTILSRRGFISGSAAALLATSLAPGAPAVEESRFHPVPSSPLPTRPFGNTGARVPLLTFGGGGPWLTGGDDTALRILSEALDQGVTCIDTAYTYGDGKSERLIGALMSRRRREVLIHTKISTRDPNKWWRHFETSLKRLNVEYVDTLMVHHLEDEADLAQCEVKGGPLELLYRAREQRLARWIGVSCHTSSAILLKLIRRHSLDHVMFPLNVATNGFSDLGFEEEALPEAVAQGLGVTAMKVLGAGQIVNQHPDFGYRTCLRYVFSLSVPTATITLPNFQCLRQNLAVAKAPELFSPARMNEIKQKAQGEIKASFLNFMAGHRDLA